ncbi:MAG: helix-turn-helix domain-containing protein [Candidatus Dormibacteraeota bacterium]|uniref:Helix-turn-helix domain-containing protein n=1 Tax=Candidatus Amunia macphersoniae TaxID=3127014 RepID=A0A934NAV2_9BACT|nr:helix-turn-helix domain-containing protein [Candidatus Dormibacteraeota bacterium]
MQPLDRVTTTEAAKLTGRSIDAVRAAIRRGSLSASNVRGHWLIESEAVIRWDKRTRRQPAYRRPSAHERSAEIIGIYYSVSAHELASLAGIHIGNARKHLTLLAQEGRVQRLEGDQWVLTVDQEQGVA